MGIGPGNDDSYYIPSPGESGEASFADLYGRPVYGHRGARHRKRPDGTWYDDMGAAEEDVARWRQMGERRFMPAHFDEGPQGEVRDLQMGSLGYLESGARGASEDMRLLGSSARGEAPSRAEMLGNQMMDRSLKSQVSAAGNVRGGPGASAAAYRAASQNAGLQRADMLRGIQAERAAEIAGARRDYAGAMGAARRDYMTGTTGVRGQDIGVATEKARLEAEERRRATQMEQFYEDLAQRTRVEDARQRQGNVIASDNEDNTKRAMRNAESQADHQRMKDYVGLTGDVVGGGFDAYYKGRQDSRDQGRYDNDYSNSDVRTKNEIPWGSLAPMTWGAPTKTGTTDREDRDNDGDKDSSPKSTIGTYSGGIEHTFPEARDPQGYRGGIFTVDPYRDTTVSDERAKREAFEQGAQTGYKFATGDDVTWGEEGPKPVEGPEHEVAPAVHELPPPKAPPMVAEKASSAKAPKEAVQFSVKRPDPLENKPNQTRAPSLEDQRRWEEILRGGFDANQAASFVARPPTPPTPKAMTMGAVYRPSGRKRDTTSSDERTKHKSDDWDVVALADRGDEKLQIGDNDRAFYRSSSADDGRPSLSGGESKSKAPAKPATPKPASKPKTSTPDDLMKMANELGRRQQSEHDARMAAGPAVRDTTTSDKDGKYVYSDEKTKDMARAARSMDPSVYAYKPGFEVRSGQEPGELNVGPMANKMAKNPIASTAIVQDEDTGLLAIDKDKGLKLVMGSLASLQHQIDNLHHDEPRTGGAYRSRHGRAA